MPRYENNSPVKNFNLNDTSSLIELLENEKSSEWLFRKDYPYPEPTGYDHNIPFKSIRKGKDYERKYLSYPSFPSATKFLLQKGYFFAGKLYEISDRKGVKEFLENLRNGKYNKEICLENLKKRRDNLQTKLK